MMHIRGKYQSTGDEERLASHRGRVALFKIHFAFAVLRDSWILGKVFGDKHGTFKRTRWHAVSLQLLVRMRKVTFMVRDLLGSEYATQLFVRHFGRILQSELASFRVREGEGSSKKREFFERETKAITQAVDSRFDIVLVRELGATVSALTLHLRSPTRAHVREIYIAFVCRRAQCADLGKRDGMTLFDGIDCPAW